MRITTGAVIGARQLATVSGPPLAVPDPARLIHLQFRRFAGCPVCSLHLRSFASRHGELAAAGIREAAVFHAPAAELRPQVTGLPFAVIADPGKRLYAEFGVESARRALLDPRAWPAIARGLAASLIDVVRRRRPAPALRPHGGRFGLPADFLIAPDGRVLAVKYGEHASDHWPVSEVLALARAAQDQHPAVPAPAAGPGGR
ncbi:MAG: peroxiredoxin-like family protein [Gemmatimonadota bacterium]